MKDAKVLMEAFKKMMVKEDEAAKIELDPKAKANITVDVDNQADGLEVNGMTQLLMALAGTDAKEGFVAFFKDIGVSEATLKDLEKFFELATAFPKNSHEKGEGKNAKLSELMNLSMKIDADLYSNPKVLAKIMTKIGGMAGAKKEDEAAE